MSRSYFIETYGCQMNKAESAAIERQFLERGWRAGEAGSADFVLINTCSVRATAETRAWGRIDHYAALKRARPFFLAVAGCMADNLGEELRLKAGAVDFVIGNLQKTDMAPYILAAEGGSQGDFPKPQAYNFAPSHQEAGAFKAFLPVMHGCDNFCSYCIVPYLRGRESSRSPGQIMAELGRMAADGVRELTLLGQNVNSYRYQEGGHGLSFAGLLSQVAASPHVTLDPAGPGIHWLRFLSSHPKDLGQDIIDVMASSRVFCRHIHLCVQHGSDRILKAMNRQYGVNDYLNLVSRLRQAMPDLSLSTDILVGFPGEEEADLEATLDLMRTVGFEYAFMYYFNPRRGTKAAQLPGQLPLAQKKARLSRVIQTQAAISQERQKTRLGQEAWVLVESISRRSPRELLGRSERDETVVFTGDAKMLGSFVRVALNSLSGKTFRGSVL